MHQPPGTAESSEAAVVSPRVAQSREHPLALHGPAGGGSVASTSGDHGPVAQRQSGESNDLAGRKLETSQVRPNVRPERLYAVARLDLPVGLRTAQVGHALIEWVLRHGEPPENLVVLAVRDQEHLMQVAGKLMGDEHRLEVFNEPDLDMDATALVVGPESWRVLSSLPLLR